MASFFQKLGRAITGKARILNENPLTSETTIPNANWNERWGKRQQNAASNTSSAVRNAVEAIRGFLANPRLPDRAYNCTTDLATVLLTIQRINGETDHQQMAMELTNYVKKRVRVLRGLSTAEANALESALQVEIENLRIRAGTEEARRRAANVARAIRQLGVTVGAHEEEEEENIENAENAENAENIESVNSNTLLDQFMTHGTVANVEAAPHVNAENVEGNALLAEFLAQERVRTEGVQPTAATTRNRTHSNEMLEQFLANEAAKAKKRKGGSRRKRLSRKKNRRLTRRRR
jgi:hypothetical protein